MQATRTAKKAIAVAVALRVIAVAVALQAGAVAVALQVKKAFSLQEALVLQAAAQTSQFYQTDVHPLLI